MARQRLQVLRDLDVPEGMGDADFNRLTRLAARLLEAPVSLLVLVDADREYFASRYGTDATSSPLGFAAHTIAGAAPLVVPDALADDRFPAPEAYRFYAGAPIAVNGERLGALCVLDHSPRLGIDEHRLDQLADLAGVASSLFELKHEANVRARTATELIREEWRHALTLEAGHVGSWVWDVPTGAVTGNDIVRRMYGLDPVKQITADDFFAAVAEDHLPAVRAALQATFDDGVDYVAEFRVKSGRWISSRGRVYQRNARSEPLVMMGVSLDITQARRAADHTRHLLRELNHRVKNTLAMTQALARQTLKQSDNAQEFIDAFSGRLRTLADAHALLADHDWSGIGITELVDSQVAPYSIADPARVKVLGEDVELPPDHALGLGIVLHELASNAARFGALSSGGGTVRIAWEVKDRELHLTWTESGGPRVPPERATGFGSRLIQRSLDKILGSSVSLDFAPEGVEARVSFPLD